MRAQQGRNCRRGRLEGKFSLFSLLSWEQENISLARTSHMTPQEDRAHRRAKGRGRVIAQHLVSFTTAHHNYEVRATVCFVPFLLVPGWVACVEVSGRLGYQVCTCPFEYSIVRANTTDVGVCETTGYTRSLMRNLTTAAPVKGWGDASTCVGLLLYERSMTLEPQLVANAKITDI